MISSMAASSKANWCKLRKSGARDTNSARIFGHAGAVAFSRTSFFDGNKPVHKHVLRRFGQVPDAYLKETTGE